MNENLIVDDDDIIELPDTFPIADSNTINIEASYHDRIAQKEVMENNLWRRIKQVVPWKIEVSTVREDVNYGIDAKCFMGSDSKSIQLKQRNTGNDILMETILVPENVRSLDTIVWTGRDSKHDVDLYFCVDTKYILRIVDGIYLQDTARIMSKEFLQKYLNDKNTTYVRTLYGDVRIKREESEQASFKIGKVNKILVFIEPDKISEKVLHKFNI